MEKQFKRVGTHSGRFHADDVMSTALLKELFDIDVIRSRDPDILDGLELIYDVGEGEFDHHQLDKQYRENGTPYAACGLIWRHFGRDIIRSWDRTISNQDLEYIFHKTDRLLIEGIDAADNGLKTCRMIIPTLSISTIIAKFNPEWDSAISQDNAFQEAVELASIVFRNVLKQKFSLVRAREYVQKAYENRNVPELLLLDRAYPWRDLLDEIDMDEEVVYVIYPENDQYLILTVRRKDAPFGDVKPLPRSWAGKRDEELSEITGVADAVFCHANRFIASAKSLEGILKMSELALAERPEPDEADESAQIKAAGFLKSIAGFLINGRIRIYR